MPRIEFQTYNETLIAAMEKIPYGRKPLRQRNSRELHSIRILGHWVIGASTSFLLKVTKKWMPSDREYVDIESFQAEMPEIMANKNVRIHNWYMYQPVNDPHQSVFLQSLDKIPLDVQLMHYTDGDGFNMIKFHDINEPAKLTPGGIIVHRKTGQHFNVPAITKECLLQHVP